MSSNWFKNILVTIALFFSFPAQAAFPESWVGHWKGVCKLSPASQGIESTPMELVIQPEASQDRFVWQIIYGRGSSREVRDYRMLSVDPATGHYLLDERSGILIDHYLSAGVLRSQFEISGKRISSREEIRGGTLHVEMISFRAASDRTSSGFGYRVDSFEMLFTQTCELRK